jgi:hypothetical protein
MRANEKGVVIGNQAVLTRMPLVKIGGPAAVDLLRPAWSVQSMQKEIGDGS